MIDIETSNTFDDVGGKENLTDLNISLVGVYSYLTNSLKSFREGGLEPLSEILKEASLIIGFGIRRFDLPILKASLNFNINKIPHIDLLDEIEKNYGRRISLDLLAKANLGVGKLSHGLEAVKFYQAGDWDSLEKYCLQDVVLTRDLYDLCQRQKYLMVPQKFNPRPIRVDLDIKEPISEDKNTLFS